MNMHEYGSDTHSSGGNGRPRAVVLKPGSRYGLMWAILIFVGGGFFVAIGIKAYSAPLNQGDLEVGLVVLAISALSIVGMRYLRTKVTLMVGDSGVRLYRGDTLKRELDWDQIAGVRHGTKLRSVGEYYFLKIRPSGRQRGISVDGASYSIDRGELADIAGVISERVGARSGEVTQKSIYDVHRGALLVRIFGPRAPLRAAGMAWASASILLVGIWLLANEGIRWTTAIMIFVSGLSLITSVRSSLTSRRYYCTNCNGFRYFSERRGNWRYERCGKTLQNPPIESEPSKIEAHR